MPDPDESGAPDRERSVLLLRDPLRWEELPTIGLGLERSRINVVESAHIEERAPNISFDQESIGSRIECDCVIEVACPLFH